MAFDRYIGTDGAWGTAGNWESGVVPVDDDDALIPSSGTTNIAGSNQSGVTLGTFAIDADYVGNIGTDGDPLVIDASKVLHQGKGTIRLKSADEHVTSSVCIDSDCGDLAAHLDGDHVYRAQILKGKVTLASTLGAGTAPMYVDVAHRDSPSSDAHVTINCDMNASGILKITGGYVSTTAAGSPVIPTVIQSAGFWEHGANAGAVTTYYGLGGRCHWKPSSTLTTAHVHAGCVLDLTQGPHPTTITNLYRYAGGKVIYRPGVDTITNDFNRGGDLEAKRTKSVIRTGSGN